MRALVFDEVTLDYGGSPVVRAATLRVDAGEVVGLVGPNGAGKSTLLRGVTGSAVIRDGSVNIGDVSVGAASARERARAVAVLPQSVSVEAPFSGYEYVAMGRHSHVGRLASFGALDDEVVAGALERTDTAHLADRSVTALSGGELQRLALAQALAQEPDILLLDEPTNHLDVNHRLQILELCRGLAADGMAVLGVFHDLDLAARYADRIVVVAEGRIVADGTPEDVLRPGLLREVFRVRAVVGSDPATGTVSVTPLLRMEEGVDRARGRVLVVGGSGYASWLMTELLGRGFDVRLAATSIGDTDHAVADVLGVPVVEMAPFAEMDGTVEARVAVEASGADAVVVASTPFGRANVANLRAAVRAGVPLVLVGRMDDERDFTSGEASRLWDEAVASGASVVEEREAAVACIEGMVR